MPDVRVVVASVALFAVFWLAVVLAYDRGFAEGRASAPEKQCGPCPCVSYDYVASFIRIALFSLGLFEISFALYPRIRRRMQDVQKDVVKTEETS